MNDQSRYCTPHVSMQCLAPAQVIRQMIANNKNGHGTVIWCVALINEHAFPDFVINVDWGLTCACEQEENVGIRFPPHLVSVTSEVLERITRSVSAASEFFLISSIVELNYPNKLITADTMCERSDRMGDSNEPNP